MAYRFISEFKNIFGIRWLFRRLKVSKTAYYNYLKKKKYNYYREKNRILKLIEYYYHKYNGVYGYRFMRIFLKREGILLSSYTVHKYMNKELGLKSVVRRKKNKYVKSGTGSVFPDLINRDFTACSMNNRWCTDFTYLTLANGEKLYNCTIIDLFD